MPRSVIAFGLAFALALPALALAQDHVPSCVTVAGTARYGSGGYNHIVSIRNGCERSVSCQVATNVNPQPTAVTVAAGESTEVVTFLGSPAREFTTRVRCEQDP